MLFLVIHQPQTARRRIFAGPDAGRDRPLSNPSMPLSDRCMCGRAMYLGIASDAAVSSMVLLLSGDTTSCLCSRVTVDDKRSNDSRVSLQEQGSLYLRLVCVSGSHPSPPAAETLSTPFLAIATRGHRLCSVRRTPTIFALPVPSTPHRSLSQQIPASPDHAQPTAGLIDKLSDGTRELEVCMPEKETEVLAWMDWPRDCRCGRRGSPQISGEQGCAPN